MSDMDFNEANQRLINNVCKIKNIFVNNLCALVTIINITVSQSESRIIVYDTSSVD